MSLLLARARWKCPIPQATTASSGNRTTGAMGGRRADVTVRPCSLCCVSVSCVLRLATDMLTLVNVWLKKILRSVTFSAHKLRPAHCTELVRNNTRQWLVRTGLVFLTSCQSDSSASGRDAEEVDSRHLSCEPDHETWSYRRRFELGGRKALQNLGSRPVKMFILSDIPASFNLSEVLASSLSGTAQSQRR